MREDTTLSDLYAKELKAIRLFFVTNFPKSFQLFKDSEIHFKTNIGIQLDLVSFLIYNKKERIVFQFSKDLKEDVYSFYFHSENEKYESFEFRLDSMLGFPPNDLLIYDSIYPILFQTK